MKTINSLVLSVAVLLSLIVAASADIFLKFTSAPGTPAIVGEATLASGHENEIVAVSFKAGVFQKGQELAKGSGASAGKSEFKPVTVFKYIDKASAGLFLACATGARYPTVTLTVSNPESTPAFASPPNRPVGDYFRIVLNDVFVTSINQDADATDSFDNLVETVELTYQKIFWYYTPASGGGPSVAIKGGFDVVKNKPLPAP